VEHILDAIQKKGLKLVMADGAEHFIKDVIATDMSKAGSQDVVILALAGPICASARSSDAGFVVLRRWWSRPRMAFPGGIAHGKEFEGQRIQSRPRRHR